MNRNDAIRVYGLVLEHDLGDSLYKSFGEIPEEHQQALNSGIKDLKAGKKQEARQFIRHIKAKHGLQ